MADAIEGYKEFLARTTDNENDVVDDQSQDSPALEVLSRAACQQQTFD